MNCIFCKIISGEIQSEKIFENEKCIVIKDIDPKAKYHYLMIPKKHYKYLAEQEKADTQILGEMLNLIPSLSDILHLEGGYRIVINQGDNAGQSVGHLHIHILCGEKMNWNPA